MKTTGWQQHSVALVQVFFTSSRLSARTAWSHASCRVDRGERIYRSARATRPQQINDPRPYSDRCRVDHVRSLGVVTLRTRWRSMFDKLPPAGLTKDIIARMIASRIQEDAFGSLDKDWIKLLDRLARGDKPGEVKEPQARHRPGPGSIKANAIRSPPALLRATDAQCQERR